MFVFNISSTPLHSSYLFMIWFKWCILNSMQRQAQCSRPAARTICCGDLRLRPSEICFFFFLPKPHGLNWLLGNIFMLHLPFRVLHNTAQQKQSYWAFGCTVFSAGQKQSTSIEWFKAFGFHLTFTTDGLLYVSWPPLVVKMILNHGARIVNCKINMLNIHDK